MKNLFFSIAIAATAFTACNNSNNKTSDASKTNADTEQTSVPTANAETAGTGSIKGIVSGYLQLKNALAEDNGNDAAAGGKAILAALDKLDTTAFSSTQRIAYKAVADDVKENAEHIGENAGKIAHQREHFEMLSGDIYDLVKAFGGGQVLYRDYCPMYNNEKGAMWISEAKEIKNPYLGKKMSGCGSVKEELK
jgi:hypothetical protein